jgi:tetratricopeptide (TPR) repeat protein
MSLGGQSSFQILAGLLPFASAVPTATPVPTITVTPTITSTATLTPTPRPTITSLVTALPSATYIFDSDSSSVFETVNTPQGGIPLEATSFALKTDKDYYTRALVASSLRAVGSEYIYQQKMIQALEDINAAIALNAENGNYYALRQKIYYKLGGLELYAVDSQVFYRLALADAYKANILGTTIEQYPERTIIVDLIMSDQCDVALVETQKLVDKTPKEQTQYGGVLSLRSRVYSCLGRLDEALQDIRDSMFNNQNIGVKEELEAIYLVQAGHNDEALNLINKAIACCSSGGGHRYFQRAFIYYAKGQKDLARKDIFSGIPNTWYRGGFLAYVQAQFALDDGDKKEAINLLQLAEASLDPVHNPFRRKIQRQLAGLGARPISPTPSVFLGEETPFP